MTAPVLNCAVFYDGDKRFLAIGTGAITLKMCDIGCTYRVHPPGRTTGSYPAFFKFMIDAIKERRLTPMTWEAVKTRLKVPDPRHLAEDVPAWVAGGA